MIIRPYGGAVFGNDGDADVNSTLNSDDTHDGADGFDNFAFFADNPTYIGRVDGDQIVGGITLFLLDVNFDVFRDSSNVLEDKL